jgi:hypothetical protein
VFTVLSSLINPPSSAFRLSAGASALVRVRTASETPGQREHGAEHVRADIQLDKLRQVACLHQAAERRTKD